MKLPSALIVKINRIFPVEAANFMFFRIFILFVCLILPISTFAETGKIKFQRTAVSTNSNQLANPFRTIGNFFKRIFGIKRVVREYPPPLISNIYFSQAVVIKKSATCKKVCTETDQSIIVTTEVSDYEPDQLLYVYEVTGGRIVGKGATVIWDLAEAKPGKYSMRAYVDDGCGDCGGSKTREIEVFECAECQEKTQIINRSDSPPQITSISFTKTDSASDCAATNETKDKFCASEFQKIIVTTNAIEIPNKPFKYAYSVTAGEIDGEGSKVFWDLTGVKPGKHLISAMIDDGCGFCGQPTVRSIEIVECVECENQDKLE